MIKGVFRTLSNIYDKYFLAKLVGKLLNLANRSTVLANEIPSWQGCNDVCDNVENHHC